MRRTMRLALPPTLRRTLRLVALLSLLIVPALAAFPAYQGRILGGYALDADGSVRIHNHDGSIRVVGWRRDSVAVRGTIGSRGSFFGGGTRRGIKLGVEMPAGASSSASEIVVQVPLKASVVIRGAATNIVIEGLTGHVDVSAVTGSITVFASPENLVAETMEGSCLVTGTVGILRVKTATGRLRWSGTAEDATLGSVSGRIELAGGPVGRARVETISGDVMLDATLRPDADITIESHSGTIGFHPRSEVPILIRADAAKVGGESIPTTSGFMKSGKREPQRLIPLFGASEGAPGASLTARSFKGEFVLLAKPPAS
jgi:hypothetical protein